MWKWTSYIGRIHTWTNRKSDVLQNTSIIFADSSFFFRFSLSVFTCSFQQLLLDSLWICHSKLMFVCFFFFALASVLSNIFLQFPLQWMQSIQRYIETITKRLSASFSVLSVLFLYPIDITWMSGQHELDSDGFFLLRKQLNFLSLFSKNLPTFRRIRTLFKRSHFWPDRKVLCFRQNNWNDGSLSKMTEITIWKCTKTIFQTATSGY